ncbi:MAG: hypothetical protein ACFB4J_04470 [Elainellaceae cyanobacterium]
MATVSARTALSIGMLIVLSGLAIACRRDADPNAFPAPIETPPAVETPPGSLPESVPGSAPVSLVPVPRASETPPPKPSGEMAELVVGEGETAALRADPSGEAATVASGGGGDRLQILEARRADGGAVWYHARLDGSEGWVQGQFVNFSEAYGSTSRPFVVLPGGGSVHAEPDAESEVLQELEGGSAVAVTERYYNEGVWFYSGGGWIAGENLFRPACIEFNDYLPLVVASGGTTVHSTAAYQIPVESRLVGGEIVFPSEVTQNNTGTWFKTDQGWISGQSAFYPFCESAETSHQTPPSKIQISSKVR